MATKVKVCPCCETWTTTDTKTCPTCHAELITTDYTDIFLVKYLQRYKSNTFLMF